jgi:hypothetical protein
MVSMVLVDDMYCSSFFMGVNEEDIRGRLFRQHRCTMERMNMLSWHNEETVVAIRIAVCFWKEF